MSVQSRFEKTKAEVMNSLTLRSTTSKASYLELLREPDFADICGFIQTFAVPLRLNDVPNFHNLLDYLCNTETFPTELQQFIKQLLEKNNNKRGLDNNKILRRLIRFCAKYSEEDAAIIENIGFHALSVRKKLRVLKELFENLLIKNHALIKYIETQSPSQLRSQLLGRDRYRNNYWLRMNILGKWTIYRCAGDIHHSVPLAHTREQILEVIARLSHQVNTKRFTDEQQLVIFLTALSETL